MSEQKKTIEVISVDYIDVRPTLTTRVIHTLIQASIAGRSVFIEVDREVTDPDEIKDLLIAEMKKPPDPFRGLLWEVE